MYWSFRCSTFVSWSLAALALSIVLSVPAAAQIRSGLVSQRQAASVGLRRAWFARAEVNPARSRVVDWILSNDQLLLVTDAGLIQALDANTGKSLWVTVFGDPNYPSLGPAANEEYVAVVNGSTIYLIDRADGRIQSRRSVGGAPGSGPALSKTYVFIPTMNGLIEGYPLDPNAPVGSRWFYQSFGRALVPPLVTAHSVVWTTDAGFLYVSGAENLGVRFRLETLGEFDARPAYRTPLIYAVTLGGELFAVDEQQGSLEWRYLTGFPTDRAPAAVGDRLFVSSEEPMLHCVDATTGLGQWEAPGISQFATVTKSHVYGVDRFGTIHILNIADGAPVARIPTGGELTALVNDQTDRLFLISASGLVQCLYEIGADVPTHYVERAGATEKEPESKPKTEPAYEGEGEPPAAEPLPPQDASPADSPAAEDEVGPFGAPAEEEPPPAEESDFGTDDENPFG